ncbi:MAG: UbiD family decarboxylase [Clostridia bacterium]|nr:MAG: UbiD family decarboxylase [Clostridia bacterium]
MAYMDLREFIDGLESHGELIRVKKEVDWNLEAGAIVRRTHEEGLPAPYFEKIKGYPDGYGLVGGILGGSKVNGKWMPFRRIAIAMGMDPDSPTQEIIEEYIRRKNTPIKPIVVSTGPCKENIRLGKEVNLFEFPAPMIHDGDGGRFLATWHVVVTKDPDTEWVNWGMYRGMIQTRTKLAWLALPMQHGPAMYYQKYRDRGKSMPIAFALGTDIYSTFAACSYLPAGINESDVAGGLAGQPVPLVKCETSDLYVPANSEIVIEAEIRPGELIEEGPFGEFTGYRTSERAPRTFVRVNCITYRNNPILPMSCMGMPMDDSATTGSISISAELTELLRDQMRHPIRGVYNAPEGSNALLVVSTKVPHANFAHKIASAIWSAKAGIFAYWIMVVEDDVDPFDLNQVIHAMTFKCHPVRGIRQVEHYPGMPLDPFLSLYERHYGLGAAVLFDCTWPKDWAYTPIESSFHGIYPQELQQKVLANWKDYGYK